MLITSPTLVILIVSSTHQSDAHGHSATRSGLECSAEQLLDLYRKRGKAEAHMGELKSTLDLHLPSTNRGASTVQQVMARNQVNLLLSLYVYQLMQEKTGKGRSLRRLREQLLKVAATLTRSCPADQGQSGCCRQQVVADLARSPLPTANRVADISWHRGSYPQRIISNSRESRLPASRKSGSGKLESDKKSVKKASKLSKK